MEIKVNEFVRIKNGAIRKIIKINEGKEKTIFGKYRLDKPYNNCFSVAQNKIVKHSPNIIDLIEVGDILKLKDGEKWEVQEHQGDGNWIQTEWEVIENEEDLKSKVDSILTKEQFSSSEYII